MNAIDDAVNSALVAGTALITALGGTAIYWRIADQGTPYPYVTFSKATGTEENSSPRRARRVMYTVMAVSDNPDKAGDIDDEIDTLLHGATLTITGWGNYRTARETDIDYEEVTNAGQVVYHRGGQYGIWIAE